MAYLTSNQTTDSQVVSPVITFQVNLETVGTPGWLQPNRTTLDGNETVTEASNMKSTRTIWLPGLLNGNYEGIGPTGYLHHGQQFTVKGQQAIYLKKTYVTGATTDILTVVSQS